MLHVDKRNFKRWYGKESIPGIRYRHIQNGDLIYQIRGSRRPE